MESVPLLFMTAGFQGMTSGIVEDSGSLEDQAKLRNAYLIWMLVPGLEKFCSSQPEPQRMLHQAAQGSGKAGKRPLLDH